MRQHLHDARRRLVTVIGPGGIGKTSLALQVAADLAESTFADGVGVAWLASAVTMADVPLAIAEALSLPIQGSRPILDQLIAAMRERSLQLHLGAVVGLGNLQSSLEPPILPRRQRKTAP